MESSEAEERVITLQELNDLFDKREIGPMEYYSIMTKMVGNQRAKELFNERLKKQMYKYFNLEEVPDENAVQDKSEV